MSTDPEETSEENPARKDKIERVPEGTFGGTGERLSEVEGGEPVSDDRGDQGHGQNWAANEPVVKFAENSGENSRL